MMDLVMVPASGMAKRALAAMRAPGRRPDTATPSGIGVPGCRAATPIGSAGGSEPCPGEVVWTGLLLVRATGGRPAQVWQAFACDEHGTGLISRRPLRAGDQAILGRWRAHAQGDDTGQPYDPPSPLAEGDVAHELIHRARHWNVSHYDE